MRPPTLGRWLLALTLSNDPMSRSIVGDLAEEYGLRRERDGAGAAWLWFHRQALGVAARHLPKQGRGAWRALREGEVTSDVRFAWRALRAHPAVHSMVLAVIAAGVGGTAVAFSMVDQALLRALPYAAPEEVFQLRHLSLDAGVDAGLLSPADVMDLRERLGWERSLATYAFNPTSSLQTLTGDDAPPLGLASAFVDGAFFGVLGVPATVGRTFAASDNVPGQDRVVVLSHGLWIQRFGADAEIIGRSLRLNGDLFEVVGVMPPSFQFPSPEALLWLPASLMTEEMVPDRRGVRYRQGIVRVAAPGTAFDARTAAERIFSRLAEEYPESNDGWTRAELVPLREILFGGVRTGLLFLMGVTGLLLLVVAASVGGILTARGSSRTREMAIRLSLGAHRSRLRRQLILESLLLAGIGGAIGLGFAWLAASTISSFTSQTLGFAADVTPNLRVGAFTLLVSLATGVAFGVIPTWSVLSASPHIHLGGARGGVGRARGGVRALVLVETALATVLLAGTGLMTRSFLNLVRTDPGFVAENVWSLRLQISGTSDAAQLVQDRRRIVEIAEGVPGVVSVGASKTPLLEGGGEPYTLTSTGPEGDLVEITPESGVYMVLPGFFETLGARFVSGRPFTDDDSELSVVVNRAFADNLWPNRDPLTEELTIGPTRLPVTGVVETLHEDGLAAGSKAAVYINAANFPRTSLYLFVRTAPGGDAAVAAVREAIWEEFPEQAFLDTRPVSGLLDEAVARPRWLARVIGGFAALAVVLAALGVYGVVSQAVNTQRGEIAVRIALGAGPQRVLWDQLGTGLLIIVLGTVGGLTTALGLGRFISGLLFGVPPHDLTAFTGAGLIVIGFGFVASLIPALRATRVDPAHIIREQ